MTRRGSALVALVLLIGAVCATVAAQAPPGPPPGPADRADATKDALGRTTPRGTVLSFLAAARKGDLTTASEYLQTTSKGDDAADLARQLFVVLDSRLPARLNELSDRPEGSLRNPLKPDIDSVGTITSATGPVEILLSRVAPTTNRRIWLFSRTTLAAIPDVYDEVALVSVDAALPEFLVNRRVLGIRLYEWIAVFVGIPLLYGAIALITRLASALYRLLMRARRRAGAPVPAVPAAPLKLLLLAFAIRWILSQVGLGLTARQFWYGTSMMMAVTALTWLLIVLTAAGERYVLGHLPAAGLSGAASLLRLCRRAVEAFILLLSALVVLRYFRVDATAALAGLGVGGIAVALAAQKTLENVIAGVSLIFDRAVRVGDALKVGGIEGTVDYIGLRSTRIRTLDRTIVTIPNGQVAAATVENLSERDKFWFHPVLPLGHSTTPAQVEAVVDRIEELLSEYPLVDRESVRVRFIRLGAFSFDIEVFAYVLARDWNRFLEIQEELLIRTLQAVQAAGATLALPAQSIHVADDRPARDPSSGAQPAVPRPAPASDLTIQGA